MGEAVISIVFRAPMYAILAELKLLMTVFNVITPSFYGIESDRLKDEVLCPALVHGLFQALPMFII